MKTLLILRHAKSSWKEEGLDDHDRPLSGRGKRDAPRMGKLLKEKRLVPHAIIASTAKRARKTAIKVADAAGFEGEILFTPQLYHAGVEAMIELLYGCPTSSDRVLVVGHNPGLQELIWSLTGTDESLTTAALAHVDVEIDRWEELTRQSEAALVAVWRPRELFGEVTDQS